MVACGIFNISSYALLTVTDLGVPHRKAFYEPRFIKESEKNTELLRTETNSDSMSSYGVRKSSLLIFFIPGRKERKAQPQFRTRMTRIFMDNILSEKSINSTYPNEPQSTQTREQSSYSPAGENQHEERLGTSELKHCLVTD